MRSKPLHAMWSLCLLTGCGGPRYAEVEGIITLNGTPLPDVEVAFCPDPEKGGKGPRAVGRTDKSGRYTLVCDNQVTGAVVGTHRVVVTDLQAVPAPDRRAVAEPAASGRAGGPLVPQVKPSRIPPEYSDAGRTPLRPEVKPGPKQTINLDVKGNSPG